MWYTSILFTRIFFYIIQIRVYEICVEKQRCVTKALKVSEIVKKVMCVKKEKNINLMLGTWKIFIPLTSRKVLPYFNDFFWFWL